MDIIKFLFSEGYEETLKKAQLGYGIEKFSKILLISSFIVGILLTGFFALIFIKLNIQLYNLAWVFLITAFIFFELIKFIPVLSVQGKKALLESDLLYSARHLLLKIESGSSLLNSIESVSNLKTKSSIYFKEIMFDVSLGVPIEGSIENAIAYSPSKAYTKILEEIQSSLKTGSDLQKSLKSTLNDITKQHLIQIQEYGKKLNPMTMFYLIVGTILPSLGTAILVVGASLLSGALIIDRRILLSISFIVLVVQVFFILGFKSLKPAVME